MKSFVTNHNKESLSYNTNENLCNTNKLIYIYNANRKFLNTIENDTMQMENHIIQMKIIQCKWEI